MKHDFSDMRILFWKSGSVGVLSHLMDGGVGMILLTKNNSAVNSVSIVVFEFFLCFFFLALLWALIVFFRFPAIFFPIVSTLQLAYLDHIHDVLFPEALRLEQWSENLSIQSMPQTLSPQLEYQHYGSKLNTEKKKLNPIHLTNTTTTNRRITQDSARRNNALLNLILLFRWPSRA